MAKQGKPTMGDAGSAPNTERKGSAMLESMEAREAERLARGYRLLADAPDALSAIDRACDNAEAWMRRNGMGDAWADDARSDALETLARMIGESGSIPTAQVFGRTARRSAMRWAKRSQRETQAPKVDAEEEGESAPIPLREEGPKRNGRGQLTYRPPSMPRVSVPPVVKPANAPTPESGSLYGYVIGAESVGLARMGLAMASGMGFRSDSPMGTVAEWAKRIAPPRPMTREEACGPTIPVGKEGKVRPTYRVPMTLGTLGKQADRVSMATLDGPHWPTHAIAIGAARSIGGTVPLTVAMGSASTPTGLAQSLGLTVPSAEAECIARMDAEALAIAYMLSDPNADRYYREPTRYRRKTRTESGTVPAGTLRKERRMDWTTWAKHDGNVTRNALRWRVAQRVRKVRGNGRLLSDRLGAPTTSDPKPNANGAPMAPRLSVRLGNGSASTYAPPAPVVTLGKASQPAQSEAIGRMLMRALTGYMVPTKDGASLAMQRDVAGI